MSVGLKRQSLTVNCSAGSPVERASCPAPGPRTDPLVHVHFTRTTTRMALRARATQMTFPSRSSFDPLSPKDHDPHDRRRLRRLLSMPSMQMPILLCRHTSQTSPVTPSSTPCEPSMHLPQQGRPLHWRTKYFPKLNAQRACLTGRIGTTDTDTELSQCARSPPPNRVLTFTHAQIRLRCLIFHD